MPRARRKPANPARLMQEAKVRDFSPTMVRRIMDEARRGATDPRLGSELGRLCLTGQISDVQFRVGCRYAELRTTWRQATGLPSIHARSSDPAHPRGEGSGFDMPDALIRAETQAAGALMVCGERAAQAVNLVADRDCVIVGHQMLLDLRAGLDALGILWGMIHEVVPAAL